MTDVVKVIQTQTLSKEDREEIEMTDVVRMKGGKRVSIQFKVVPMRLALYPQVMYQASQHFRSSEKKATCESCFARQYICLVITLRSGISRLDVDH